MNTVKTMLATVVAILSCLTGALAQTLKPVPEAQAEAPIERMNQRLLHAQAMTATYTCTLMPMFDDKGNPLPQVYQITGSAERPGKIYAEIRQAGKLLGILTSDAHTLSLSNSRTKQYIQIKAPDNSTAPWDPFDNDNPASKQLADAFSVFRPHANNNQEIFTSVNMRFALSPLFFFLKGEYVYQIEYMLAKLGLSGTGKDVKAAYYVARYAANGLSIAHSEMIYTSTLPPIAGFKPENMTSTMQFDFYIDRTTRLPTRTMLSSAIVNKKGSIATPVSEYDYAVFDTVQTSLPPATFTWTPPTDAKSITTLKP